MTGAAHPVPDELAALLAQVTPGDGRFGHREHVHLAYLAVRAYGTAGAVTRMSSWLRHITAYERVPQKYHATVTRAWTELVGYHAESDPAAGGFAGFAARHQALLDKHLLRRHYTPALLSSPAARQEWAEPDLTPFPWA